MLIMCSPQQQNHQQAKKTQTALIDKNNSVAKCFIPFFDIPDQSEKTVFDFCSRVLVNKFFTYSVTHGLICISNFKVDTSIGENKVNTCITIMSYVQSTEFYYNWNRNNKLTAPVCVPLIS